MTESAPEVQESRARGRDRAEGVAVSRRDRFEATAHDLQLRRFGVPDTILDTDNFVYRAALDDRTRLIELTKNDDYDFISFDGEKVSSAANSDAAGVLRYRAGTNLDQSPQWVYLLRKPKKFADEHRAKALLRLKVEETRSLTQVPNDLSDKGYKPA